MEKDIQFTIAEASFIRDLANLPVTLPLSQAAAVAATWANILAKVEALTEAAEIKPTDNGS